MHMCEIMVIPALCVLFSCYEMVAFGNLWFHRCYTTAPILSANWLCWLWGLMMVLVQHHLDGHKSPPPIPVLEALLKKRGWESS